MSTRCNIGFYESKPTTQEIKKNGVHIYRHSDGYPEGVLPDLTPFAKEFDDYRGLDDTQYATARCIQELTNLHDSAGYDDKTGYGVMTQIAGDTEFYYAVYPGGIDVYEQNGWDNIKLNRIEQVKL